LAYCFHCNWKSGNIAKTLKELCRVLGVKYGSWTVVQAKKGQETDVVEVSLEPTGLPVGYESFSQTPDQIEKLARAYLTKRKVSISQIVRHKIGFAGVGPMSWRIIFPVMGTDGEIYGCVGRTFSLSGKPKYLNTPNIKLLWGANRPAATAVVVEGVMDALRVERALLAFRNKVAVARLGSTITHAQMNQLKEYENVVIFPDHDRAGIIGAIKLADRCSDAKLHVSMIVPPIMDDVDPGGMTDQEIVTEINDARPWGESTRKRLIAAMRKRVPQYADQIFMGTNRPSRFEGSRSGAAL
jgi:hypothetical protein